MREELFPGPYAPLPPSFLLLPPSSPPLSRSHFKTSALLLALKSHLSSCLSSMSSLTQLPSLVLSQEVTAGFVDPGGAWCEPCQPQWAWVGHLPFLCCFSALGFEIRAADSQSYEATPLGVKDSAWHKATGTPSRRQGRRALVNRCSPDTYFTFLLSAVDWQSLRHTFRKKHKAHTYPIKYLLLGRASVITVLVRCIIR